MLFSYEKQNVLKGKIFSLKIFFQHIQIHRHYGHREGEIQPAAFHFLFLSLHKSMHKADLLSNLVSYSTMYY